MSFCRSRQPQRQLPIRSKVTLDECLDRRRIAPLDDSGVTGYEPDDRPGSRYRQGRWLCLRCFALKAVRYVDDDRGEARIGVRGGCPPLG
jgi:hypothetical protein